VASAADHGELIDSPAGRPGSSSAPGSRSSLIQPRSGFARTRLQAKLPYLAAVPSAVGPMFAVQCHHGQGVFGVLCLVMAASMRL